MLRNKNESAARVAKTTTNSGGARVPTEIKITDILMRFPVAGDAHKLPHLHFSLLCPALLFAKGRGDLYNTATELNQSTHSSPKN